MKDEEERTFQAGKSVISVRGQKGQGGGNPEGLVVGGVGGGRGWQGRSWRLPGASGRNFLPRAVGTLRSVQKQGRSWSALLVCHGLCWLVSTQGHHHPPTLTLPGPTHQWHQLPLLHDFRQHLSPG